MNLWKIIEDEKFVLHLQSYLNSPMSLASLEKKNATENINSEKELKFSHLHIDFFSFAAKTDSFSFL